MSEVHLSPRDAANLLAGQAVAEAEAYLAERRDAVACALAGESLWRATLRPRDPEDRRILDPVRMLATVMIRIPFADTDERRAKWRRVMAALTDLVRHESLALRAPAQPGPDRARMICAARP